MNVVAVVGLGYVGLPLAAAFGKIVPTIGYDLPSTKLDSYRRHLDLSDTVSEHDMPSATQLPFTSDAGALAQEEYIIVAAPAPIEHDPVADSFDAQQEYGLTLLPWDGLPQADAVIVAVSHAALLNKPLYEYLGKIKSQGCFVDVKSRFDAHALQAAGLIVWQL